MPSWRKQESIIVYKQADVTCKCAINTTPHYDVEQGSEDAFSLNTHLCGHPPRADLDIQPLKHHQRCEPPCRTAQLGCSLTLKTLSTPQHSPLTAVELPRPHDNQDTLILQPPSSRTSQPPSSGTHLPAQSRGSTRWNELENRRVTKG